MVLLSTLLRADEGNRMTSPRPDWVMSGGAARAVP
jgi:hypothetical protein